ncbi:hypothetical protein [Ruminococcus sp.]|uniref:hypothetical protein n=1 Tax=Ruminococcus sp. TaxID=41978 RepID=UPI0025FEB6C7|nr:hypothetical protein [Ruminococcus sp.]MBR1430668.1 hypothetical protein [Ruminococcus sp.]
MKMVSALIRESYTFSSPSEVITGSSADIILEKSERSDLYLPLPKRQKGYQGSLPDKRMMYGQVRTNSVLATIVISAGDRDSENSTWRIKK